MLNQLEPWRDFTPMQILAFGQLNTGEKLDDIQHRVPIDFTIGDLLIAMLTRLEHQIVGFDCIPESFKIHWRKPAFDLIYIFESSHSSKIAKMDTAMQIQHGKRG